MCCCLSNLEIFDGTMADFGFVIHFGMFTGNNNQVDIGLVKGDCLSIADHIQ